MTSIKVFYNDLSGKDLVIGSIYLKHRGDGTSSKVKYVEKLDKEEYRFTSLDDNSESFILDGYEVSICLEKMENKED
jgi:hypothetical protein